MGAEDKEEDEEEGRRRRSSINCDLEPSNQPGKLPF